MMNYNQGNANALMTMLQHHTRHIITYSNSHLSRVLIVTKYKEVVDLEDNNSDWYDYEENLIFQMNAWSAISENPDAFVKVEKIPGVAIEDAVYGIGEVEGADITIYRTNKTNLEKALRGEIRKFMNNYGA